MEQASNTQRSCLLCILIAADTETCEQSHRSLHLTGDSDSDSSQHYALIPSCWEANVQGVP